MKLTLSLLCIFALILTIGAPPVVDNPDNRDRPPNGKEAKDAEDVV